MSKRYGRQQKRKHRALIKSLQEQADNTSKNIQIAKNIVDIAYKICPNSVCFEPAKISADTYEFNHHDAMMLNLNPLVHGSAAIETKIDIKRINLYQLDIDLRECEFSRAVHFEASLYSRREGEYRSAYRISKEGIKHIPKQEIANQLTDHLVSQVR